MVKERAASSVTLISGAAGSVTEEIQHRLREVFQNDRVLDFDREQDFRSPAVWPGPTILSASFRWASQRTSRRLSSSPTTAGRRRSPSGV
jgi:hypothetical protein